MILRERSYLLESKGLNVATTPLPKARAYAEKVSKEAGKELSDVLPNFDTDYMVLQNYAKKAPDIPRIDMPVIRRQNMDDFQDKLRKGKIDIVPPFAKGKFFTPKNLDKQTGDEWLELGWNDGDKKDDVVNAQKKTITASKLKPTQSQIWLEKVLKWLIIDGVPKKGSPIMSFPMIVSKEGYILDGHHRYAQVLLGNPKLKMKVLRVPLSIKTLLKVGRSYGNAVGNKQKA